MNTFKTKIYGVGYMFEIDAPHICKTKHGLRRISIAEVVWLGGVVFREKI